MDSSGQYSVLFVFGGIVMIVVAIALYSARLERLRQEALASFGATVGLRLVDPAVMAMMSPPTNRLMALFGPNYSEAFVQRFQGFQPFGVGHSILAKNILVGTSHNLDWYFFDYYYTTGSGKSQQRHHYAVMAARVPFTFPCLSLKPETFLTKVGQHLGLHELKFELDDFNQRYFITCNDEKLAYDILCPQMIDYLMKQPIRWWQLFGTYAMIIQDGALRPETCYEVMGEITDMLTNLPNYVCKDLGFQPQWSSAFD